MTLSTVLSLMTCAVLAILPALQLECADPPLAIAIDATASQGRIASDFIGLGYETSAVAQANYFTAGNASLIQLYRNLSHHGMVRIGGNISDHTAYVPDGTSSVQDERSVTVITHANLEHLAAFLAATGWQAMWGLNLGTSSQQDAVQEAVAVADLFKDHLHSFQIGNEVDLHGGYQQQLKTYDAYHAAFLEYRTAIRAALPGSRFSGPDSASSMEYVTRFAATEAPETRLFTLHYYRGDAHQPTSTIDHLLSPDEGWEKKLERLRSLAQSTGVPTRINEVNSYSGGGKVGVSDTLAGALWTLDFMFTLASHGINGINLQTDINQHAFISPYSPIVHDATGPCHARPPYYGMLAFAMAGSGELLATTCDRGDRTITAYATRDAPGSFRLTIINKSPLHDAELSLSLPDGVMSADAYRLIAPQIDSTTQVTFAGQAVATNGSWMPGAPESVAVASGKATLALRHSSAVVVHLY